jgi:ribonuclease HI
MIQGDQGSKSSQPLKKPFRRTGPLDAYIYKERADDSNIEEIHENVIVHLPEARKETIMYIFTDGACPGNGKKYASAAWGCLLVSCPGHVILERLSGAIPIGEPQTNQRAELTALLKGIELAEKQFRSKSDITKIQIWSDSQYSINCASVWGPSWKSRGWKKQGGEIQHLDLIKTLVQKTQDLGFKLEYKWLKGHKGGEAQHVFPWMFNHQVDALANSALR